MSHKNRDLIDFCQVRFPIEKKKIQFEHEKKTRNLEVSLTVRDMFIIDWMRWYFATKMSFFVDRFAFAVVCCVLFCIWLWPEYSNFLRRPMCEMCAKQLSFHFVVHIAIKSFSFLVSHTLLLFWFPLRLPLHISCEQYKFLCKLFIIVLFVYNFSYSMLCCNIQAVFCAIHFSIVVFYLGFEYVLQIHVMLMWSVLIAQGTVK